MQWYLRFYQTEAKFAGVPVFGDRDSLYAHLNEEYFDGGGEALDFFEFGVFEGASVRKWCKLNTNPSSRIFGFDSFEGIPAGWGGYEKGAFDTGGITPDVPDNRVHFVKGWFQDSLPLFLQSFEPKNRLVVHSDSDLYSSTLFCLVTMNHLMPRGTIVIFDEFNDAYSEYRALAEYCSICTRDFRLVAETEGLSQAVAEII